jgi:hypothetical protein
MATKVAAELEELLDQLEQKGRPPDSKALDEVVVKLSKVFGVKEDEVAVMELGPSGRTLRFVLPEKLRQVGSIPLSSNNALAARTARERRSDIINNFSVARHATVFEGVPLGRNPGQAIHKIMSTPVLRENKVIGVAQICRKGNSPTDAGPDFNSRDLSELNGLSATLARLLALCSSGEEATK